MLASQLREPTDHCIQLGICVLKTWKDNIESFFHNIGQQKSYHIHIIVIDAAIIITVTMLITKCKHKDTFSLILAINLGKGTCLFLLYK